MTTKSLSAKKKTAKKRATKKIEVAEKSRTKTGKLRTKTTISDVAREAGVAQMTVSRVVNGGSYVSAEVRKRVEQAIARLGYHPNEAARILKGQRARTIGLIVPTLADAFFSACAHAVQQVASSHGYMTLIQTSDSHAEVETHEIDMMIARNVSGLILIPMERKVSPRLLAAEAAGIPLVTLDRVVTGLSASEVLVENAAGAEEGVRHLLDHGHERIACLGYDTDLYSIHERIAGYTEAMKAARRRPILWKVDAAHSIAQLLERKLGGREAPTALFALNNVTTIHALHALEQMGISIPKDIALVGFDDLELASLLRVPVTAVRQSARELGVRGAALMFDLIRKGVESSAKEEQRGTTRLILPTELVIRNSCGCKTNLRDVPLPSSR